MRSTSTTRAKTPYTITAEVPDSAAGSTVPVVAFLGVGRLDIPGGAWRFDMSMGGQDVASTQTQVGGPTEAYSQAMSCDSKDVYTDATTSACLEDDSHLSSGVAEGTCTVVVASGTVSAEPMLPNGDYTFRVLMNDEEVGSHGFSVS